MTSTLKKQALALRVSAKKSKYLTKSVQNAVPFTLIPQTKQIMANLEEYVRIGRDSKLLASVSNRYCKYRSQQRRVRLTLSRVLSVIASYINWATNDLGRPSDDAFSAVTHESMQTLYKDAFGEAINPRTWERYIAMIKKAGYLRITAVNSREGNGDIYGYAAYKTLSEKFFQEIGITDSFRNEAVKLATEWFKKAKKSMHYPAPSTKTGRMRLKEHRTPPPEIDPFDIAHNSVFE